MKTRHLLPILLSCAALPAVVVAASLLDGPEAPEPDRPPARTRPSVLLVTIDTLRSDHVGSYGYPRARTHRLDALAAEGVRFRAARSPSRFTGPAHISILTGLQPERHGVERNGRRVEATVPTLAGPLRRAGYTSGAFVGGWPVSDEGSGLPSRFEARGDVFRLAPWVPRQGLGAPAGHLLEFGARSLGVDPDPSQRAAPAVNAEVLPWLEQSATAPFFAWVHYYDPHLPYAKHTEESRWYRMKDRDRARIVRDPEAVEQMRSWYDEDIAVADAALGELVDGARRAAGPEGVLVVVTSDHGESMGEHGLYWERDVYEPTQRVPLVLAGTGISLPPGSVIEAPARLVDVAPTILELVGVAPLADVDGRSWAARLQGGPNPPTAPALAHLVPERGERPAWSVSDGSFKLIRREPGWVGHRWSPESTELYDLASDPSERENLAGSEPARVRELERSMDPATPAGGAAEPSVSDADRERLRSLGYGD